jgi:hypothetical protein
MELERQLFDVSILMVHLLLHECHPSFHPHILIAHHIHLKLKCALLLLEFLLLDAVHIVGIGCSRCPSRPWILAPHQKFLNLLALQLEDTASISDHGGKGGLSPFQD